MTALCVIVPVLLIPACDRSHPGYGQNQVFDQDQAYRDLIQQTSFGPRVPGTAPHDACARWLIDQLTSNCDSVWTEEFSAFVPLVNDTMHFTNIIGRIGVANSRRIFLGAHWDTRPYADMDPDSARRVESFAGANDGASGVAVLLELARNLAAEPPPVGVDIVFFDGEDLGRHRANDEWCLGSTYYTTHNALPYQYGVVVDMVGETGLELRREEYSFRYARELQDRIWTIASELGEKSYLSEMESVIYDDHVPFLFKGIPTVDLIDIRYPYWHTSNDTADKCSAASLGAIGRVLLQLIYTS